MITNNLINLQGVLDKLIENLKADGFRGWDPFDGLNSHLLDMIPLIKKQHAFRLAWIQMFKRNPINFRRLFAVNPGYNIKGLALLLSSMVKIQKAGITNYDESIQVLIDIILQHRASDRAYYCWGYNFPWEARAFSVSRWKPNIIVSTFAAQAFLDLFELYQDEQHLQIGTDVAKFIERELVLEENDDEICFGYIPGESVKVHNANLMGAKLLARLFALTHEEQYRNLSIRSANYSMNLQRENGAW